MPSGPEHYRRAEDLLAGARQIRRDLERGDVYETPAAQQAAAARMTGLATAAHAEGQLAAVAARFPEAGPSDSMSLSWTDVVAATEPPADVTADQIFAEVPPDWTDLDTIVKAARRAHPDVPRGRLVAVVKALIQSERVERRDRGPAEEFRRRASAPQGAPRDRVVSGPGTR